ncbi:MAG: CCA tRNA nucleotidyltransferase [Rhodobacterales bacterium]|nr:CCA tRNA nucleotidyltransferase [Rhodobacterales bacterium]
MTGGTVTLHGDWLDHPGTQGLMAALESAGHQALAVGGCVRNALLGAPVADVDIATDARPDRVTDLAGTAGFRAVPTGVDHGTVTVIAHGRPLEVTTFRRDVETFGRHATVAFADDVAQDAARRDFTMNALYADRRGRVIDPLGGLADLQARRLRFVGDPDQRVAEDYLRILRFFRFHAWYADPAGGIDAAGLAACAAGAGGLDQLSRERLGHEMRRLLAAPDPAPAVAAMAQAGVLARVLPGADPAALAPLVHLEDGAPPDWRVRLAALGGQDVADRLRLSRAEAAALDRLTRAAQDGDGPAALAWRLGADQAAGALRLRAALTGSPLPPGWQDEVARGSTAVFPVTAADLMPALQGPDLGAALAALQRHWLDSGLTAPRADLLARARAGFPRP